MSGRFTRALEGHNWGVSTGGGPIITLRRAKVLRIWAIQFLLLGVALIGVVLVAAFVFGDPRSTARGELVSGALAGGITSILAFGFIWSWAGRNSA
jgi:hypothetical protein